MSAMATQEHQPTIVYSTVYSGEDKKKTSKLRVTGLFEGNSPVTGEFPAQMDSNAENFGDIWWRHHFDNIFQSMISRQMWQAITCMTTQFRGYICVPRPAWVDGSIFVYIKILGHLIYRLVDVP